MKIRLKKAQILYISRTPSQCMLQVSDNTLQQVERFKYHVVVLTSDGRRNKETIHRLVKQEQLCVSSIALWRQNGSFQT